MTMNLFCFSSQMTAAFSRAQRAVAVFYMALFKFYRSRDELVRNKKRPGKPGSRCFRAARCKYVPFGAKRHQVPPVGLEEGQQSSGKTTLPVNHCAPPGAQDLDPEQLAAMLRDLDRSELEQLLLTLLSKAESASE